jgi:hypothetical protein
LNLHIAAKPGFFDRPSCSNEGTETPSLLCEKYGNTKGTQADRPPVNERLDAWQKVTGVEETLVNGLLANDG